MGSALTGTESPETSRGLTIASENRYSSYERKRDYLYAHSVRADIVRELGAVSAPYTGTRFAWKRETDTEHIMAASKGVRFRAMGGGKGPGDRPPENARTTQIQPTDARVP